MFDLGTVLPSKLATKKANSLGIDLTALVARHGAGLWDDLTPLEKDLNNGVIERERGSIFSRYKVKNEVFVVTTNLRDEQTTVKMAEEL